MAEPILIKSYKEVVVPHEADTMHRVTITAILFYKSNIVSINYMKKCFVFLLSVHFVEASKLTIWLAYFTRVAESAECEMGIDNLAKIFGPTLIGYGLMSQPTEMYNATAQMFNVSMTLLKCRWYKNK